jgi:hypothetical protein
MHIPHIQRREIYQCVYQNGHVTFTHRCCANYCLSNQPDFLEQEEWLTEQVQSIEGATIIFYPKYHPELNFIEMIWGWLKAYHRRTCSYNYNDLKNNLPDTVENKLPLAFIRRASRSCERFMTGYQIGLEGPLLDYAMKKYCGHRAIPPEMTEQIRGDFKLKQEKDSKKRKRIY